MNILNRQICWHVVLSITMVPKKPADSCFLRFRSQASLIGCNLHKISLNWLHISDKIFYFIRQSWEKALVCHHWLVFLPPVKWLSATLSPKLTSWSNTSMFLLTLWLCIPWLLSCTYLVSKLQPNKDKQKEKKKRRKRKAFRNNFPNSELHYRSAKGEADMSLKNTCLDIGGQITM